MKKNIYYFNSLLRIYNKCRRKLDNLRKANRNERRQNILQKHVERLYEKLSLLNASIKQKTIAATFALSALAFVPQTAEAQVSFSPKQINPFNLASLDYNSTPTFADIDGDGDLDMLSGDFLYDYFYNDPYDYGYTTENRFMYYQNIGTTTNPDFAAPVVNPFGLTGNTNNNDYFTPVFVDLDNDGDKDLIYGDESGNFYYRQNIGTSTSPSFDVAVTDPFGLVDIGNYSAPTFLDMDGDGDLDMLSGEYDGDFFYFENTGTVSAPAFAAPVTNSFGLASIGDNYSAPAFVDMDGDGDLDLLSGGDNGDFYYFQNTGTASLPAFDAPQFNPFNLTQVGSYSYTNRSTPTFVDIDNDGDKDLMAGDEYGDFNLYKRCAVTTSTISPVSVCSYVSPSGLIKTTGGTFTDIIPNAIGCDSIITINLTINPVFDQTVTAANSLICGGSGQTNILLSSSQNGVNYFLRNNSNNAVVSGPVAGNGSPLSLSTGTITNTTTYNVFAEKLTNSQGLAFDNTDDFVDAGSGINLSNSSFSIEFWAKKKSLNSGNDDHIIGLSDNTSTNNALHVGFRSGNQFTFAFFGNDLDVNSSFTDLNWHHWAVTFDATTKARIVYRDGVQVAADVSSSNFLGTGNLRIGRAYLSDNNYFNGNLDEVRIWNTVRTSGEISSNQNTCLSGSESGLLAYYKFEDAIGSATLSSATGNHNGTLQNMDVNTAWNSGAIVCSTCDLQMSQITTVTVTATPAPTISVNSGAICSGQSFTLSPSGADTYTISGGNSIVSPTADATYSVTGTDVNGCVSTSAAIASVTVNALPSISVNSGAICSGQSFTLSPSGADTYTISGGNSIVSPTADATYSVT
ncbi:MAG: LamG domain-containing protein, partial [Bacteroidia bacterium]|nr:LamG domain-containing protein [Bacteroidia bacterium]